MSQCFKKYFFNEDFNPEQFVKLLSAECIGAEELKHQRVKIQEISDNTSALLKRNVYDNYIQFIETAKEISHLESEMYQLSQLLSDQRSLLNNLGTNQNIYLKFGDHSERNLQHNTNFQLEEDNKKKLLKLLENVEGAIGLAAVPGRVCLNSGSLLELDPLDGKPLNKVNVYLFNDALMIASWLTDNNGRSLRYKIQVIYDLQSLAVINVRDLGSVKLAFKLLAFPDVRLFQCITANNKKEWLEKYDQAKKLIFLKRNQSASINEEELEYFKVSVISSQSASSNSNVTDKYNASENEIENINSLPEWILDVTDDVDACIAQRHFEKAFSLLKISEKYLRDIEQKLDVKEIKRKHKYKTNYLVYMLTKELDTTGQSVQGADLRIARRIVRLLIYLDHDSQACQIYLRICSATLKLRFKTVKREDSTLAYITHLSAVAFSNITEISQEFLKNFNDTNCVSELIVWCSQEVKVLITNLIKQLFLPQVTLNTLVECILIIRNHCEQLCSIGLDLRNQLDSQLRIPLIKALQDAREKYVDALKVRSTEDSWQPSDLGSIHNLHKLLSELDGLGIKFPESYPKHHCWLPLTNNTLAFGKLFIGLLEDCLNILTPEILEVVEEVLFSVLKIQIQHLKTSFTKANSKQKTKLVKENAKYILDVVIHRCLELYKSVTGHQFEKLLTLEDQFIFQTILISNKPKPTSRSSVSKYFTSEYI